MSEKELKTRTELIEELEKDISVISKHFGSEHHKISIFDDGVSLRIDIEDSDMVDGDIYGNEFKYI